jgi:NAD(P)-dependent dehydrogenase (short-subunit alcohol dehydrogenase family)
MLIDIDFSGRHVFVVGGTSGTNLGIAHAFAMRGADVSVVSRSPDKVQAAVKLLEQTGARIHGLPADARDFDAVSAAFKQACDRFGMVDTPVSGAAGNFLCEAKAMSPNGFRSVVDIDLIGRFRVIRQAYAYLSRTAASIINISTPQASIPMRYQLHPASAKAGVDQLPRSLALE